MKAGDCTIAAITAVTPARGSLAPAAVASAARSLTSPSSSGRRQSCAPSARMNALTQAAPSAVGSHAANERSRAPSATSAAAAASPRSSSFSACSGDTL